MGDGGLRRGIGRIQLWGSFRLLSVGLAVGAVWFSSTHTPSLPGWSLRTFVATVCYLVVVEAENIAANVGAE